MRIWLWAACVLSANCGFHSLWSSVGKRTTEPAGCVRIKWFFLLWKSPLFFKDYHKDGYSPPIKWKGRSSLPLGGTLSQMLTSFVWNLNSILSFLHAWIFASLFGATQSHLAETCMELAVAAVPHLGTAVCWFHIRQLLSAYQQKELWMYPLARQGHIGWRTDHATAFLLSHLSCNTVGGGNRVQDQLS